MTDNQNIYLDTYLSKNLNILPPELIYIIISYMPLQYDYQFINELCGEYFFSIYHNLFIKRHTARFMDITTQRLRFTPCKCKINLNSSNICNSNRKIDRFSIYDDTLCLADDSQCISKRAIYYRNTHRFVF